MANSNFKTNNNSPEQNIDLIDNFYLKGISLFYPDTYYGQKEGKKYSFQSEWKSSRFGPWTREGFTLAVFDTTGTHELGEALTSILGWKRYFQEQVGQVKENVPNPTTPNAIWLNEQLVALEEQKKKNELNLFQEKEQVKRIQTRLAQQKEKTNAQPGGTFKKPAVVYIQPTSQFISHRLSLNDRYRLQRLVQSAGIDSRTFHQELTNKIIELTPGVEPSVAEYTAYDVTEEFRELAKVRNKNLSTVRKVDPKWISYALVDPKNPIINKLDVNSTMVAEAFQNKALQEDYQQTIEYNLVQKVFGKEITSVIVGNPEEYYEFEVTADKGPNTVAEVDINKYLEAYENTREDREQYDSDIATDNFSRIIHFQKDVVSKTVKSADWYSKPAEKTSTDVCKTLFKANLLPGSVTQLVSRSVVDSLILGRGIPMLSREGMATKLLGSSTSMAVSSALGFPKILGIPLFTASFGNFFKLGVGIVYAQPSALMTSQMGFQGAIGAGLKIGNWSTKVLIPLAPKLAGLIFKVGAFISSAATKLGITGAITSITTALGTVAPGIGNLVGAAIGVIGGFLIEKVWGFIKKHKDFFLGLLGVGLGLGLLGLGLPVLVAAVPIVLGGMAMFGSAVSPSAGGGIGGVYNSISAGFLAIFPSFALPMALSFLGLIVAIILILFIINSSAYVVPPTTYLSSTMNPYIKLEKTIESTNSGFASFDNSKLPLTVTYKVTITPLKANLTNVNLKYKCSVVKEKSSPACPKIQGSFPESIDEIKVGVPYSLTYTHNFTPPTFQDTLTIDTILLKADVVNYVFDSSISTSASVSIGNPPSECPAIWPIASGNAAPLTQGAFSPSGYSHSRMEAIDVGVSGVQVVAGNSGIAIVDQNSCYGKYVEIQSTCNSSFKSRYGHLESITVHNGEKVAMGQIIGVSGNTGNCTTGPHLHYDFRSPEDITKRYPENPPYMAKPYLPTTPPRGCYSVASCNTTIP